MELLNTRNIPPERSISFALHWYLRYPGSVIRQGFIGYRVVALLLLMTVSFIAMLFDILPVSLQRF